MITKIRRMIVAHKAISTVGALIIIGGGWYWYKTATATTTSTKYVVEDATTGTVVASVSGSGQMQAVTSINVQPKVTENVTKVLVQVGDAVKQGQVLVELDPTNEERALAQAQLSLKSAQLSLAKLTENPATTTMVQDQNSITQNQQSLVTASETLSKDYQTGFDALGSAFVDFQTITAGLQSFVNGNDIAKYQSDPDAYVNLMPTYLQAGAEPYRNAVVSSYTAAAAAYQQNLLDYHNTSRTANTATLDSLFSETYTTAQSISESVKAVKDLLNYVVDNYPTNDGLAALPTITTTFQTNMGNYTNTIDSDVSNIAGAISTITADKNAITNDALSLTEASDTLNALVAGADPLDVQSSQLSVQQQQLALQTAEQNLADCDVRAPIDGVISGIDAIVGETVPSPAVTMVGQQQVAEITLNEVDATKVKVGDPATLTFDAISNLSLAGMVVEVDPVGTVSQGVVNYNVQIALATTNNEIKPGMSVTANIVTQADQDVIAVPNAAITTTGGASYILEPATAISNAELSSSTNGGIELPATVRVPVTLGLANDTETEITSGVNVGDQIIVQTIKSSSASTASTGSSGSILGVLGGGARTGAAAGGGFTGGGARAGGTTGVRAGGGG